MRTKVSPKLMEIAHLASKIPGLKWLLKPFYYPYKERITNNRNNIFREHGAKVLYEFDKIITENGFKYSVFAGTLLGAIREKGFIKHDADIDTCMWAKDFSPKIEEVLTKAGFKLTRRFEVDGGVKAREETYQKDGVDVDIFYIYSDERFDSYQCDFGSIPGTASHQESMRKYGYVNVRRIEFPVKYEFKRIPFENIEVSAITNAEEWLTYRYGVDYMCPNPNFHDKGDNPRMWQWTDVKATFWTCE